MGAATRNLNYRVVESGHSRVVIFLRENGEEIFVMPAERLDPGTLEKVKNGGVRCGVSGPSGDGASSLQLTNTDGELLFQQKVWIRQSTWTRMLREEER